ncbi:MAG: hypothetical protein LBC18_09350 [Opitutaceae bacterium]|nr:hypothetical protein [Opitutaceae bacterium]
MTNLPRDETPQQTLDRHAEEYAITYARGRFMHEIWLRFKRNFTNAEAEKPVAAVRAELKTNGYEHCITDVTRLRRAAGFQTCLKTHAWPRTRNQA